MAESPTAISRRSLLNDVHLHSMGDSSCQIAGEGLDSAAESVTIDAAAADVGIQALESCSVNVDLTQTADGPGLRTTCSMYGPA